MSHIFIDGASSCDIMYLYLSENMGLKKKKLLYEGSDPWAFNNTTTRMWGYIEMMIFVGEKKDVRIVES